ncbi:hypothetical protein ACIQ7Q_24545 [Streptomyces sp. NPDC096176]|uniref:hypothetical protein n=1 Tax=Streptomyces sp. NPDC096176 TaxID=3366079 RepID=UPI00381F5BF8
MTSSHSIATTTSMLEAELPQLEEQQQALQKELEQVTERLESVRGALTALNALAGTTLPQPRAEVPAPADTAVQEAPTEESANDATLEPVAPVGEALQTNDAAVPAQKKTTSPRRSPRKAAAAPRRKAAAKVADEPAPRRRTKKTASGKAAQAKTVQEKEPAQDAGGLTDQVVAVLAGRPDTPLRARDVAQALGRDDTTGSINTVRSTLDRLVATSRAHRAGRGLYQAPAN